MACASTNHSRVETPQVSAKSCAELYKSIETRDQFYVALRGRALVQTADLNLDVELAVVHPGLARLEFTGPLGVRVALLVVNENWIQLFIPRENKVFRFPTAELHRDTLRRSHFLELLPVPVIPEIFFNALLTRVSLPENKTSVTCRFDAADQVYWLRLPEEKLGGRLVRVNAQSFYPETQLYFEGPLIDSAKMSQPGFEKSLRPLLQANHSELSGEGLASLPAKVEIFQTNKKILDFSWLSVESWPQFDLSAFEWRPSASMELKDY